MTYNTYNISDQGWMSKCFETLNKKEEFDIRVSGKDAKVLYEKLNHTISTIPFSKFHLPDISLKGMPINPKYIGLIFGSIGMMGGAFASINLIAGIAMIRDMNIAIKYEIEVNTDQDSVILYFRNGERK